MRPKYLLFCSYCDMIYKSDLIKFKCNSTKEDFYSKLIDTNSKIPVKIGKEQINAILSGDNSRMLSVSMKNEDTSLKDGDIAETAYFENPICNQIPVGKVIESHGTFFIKPFVDFCSLQYVCILKNK